MTTAQASLTKVAQCWRLPVPRKVWEWAEEHLRIGESESAEPGRYKVDFAPYQKEPQESFTDPEVTTTVLRWGKRLGKSQIVSNLHGSVIDENPRNILHVMPTLESRNKWSKQFLDPMIEGTECLRQKVSKDGRKKKGNTISAKKFLGGTISGIGSNAPTGFRQVQAPVVTCDEVDAMVDGREGDPVFLAFGRSENYPNSIQVVCSTDTKITLAKNGEEKKSSGSRIYDWWLESDQREWFVKCPGCKHQHILAWDNIKWPKRKDENGIEHLTEQTYYECPGCKDKWNDVKRLAAIRAGQWKATAPFHGVRGYHLSGINSVFQPKKGYVSKLHQMAAEYLEAYRKGESALTVWKNTFLCEPIEESAESIDAQPLLERRESYQPDKLPNQVCVIVNAVDVQGDRLELDVVGVGEGDEFWGIEHRRLMGNPEHNQVWDELTQACAREYKREDGIILKASAVAIDMRHKPKRVREWIKKGGHHRIYACYGQGVKNQVNLVIPKFSKLYRMWSYSVNTDQAKDIIFARLKIPDMGPRYMHFGRSEDGFDDSYFAQLTAEEKRVRYKNGFPQHFYHLPNGKRNEALDQKVYQLAALDILRPNYKVIAQSLVKGRPQEKEYQLKQQQPKPETPKPEPPIVPPIQSPHQLVPPDERTVRKGRVIGGINKAGIGFGNLGKGSYKV
jgi:phage terminase large subunit GpA-like protein